MNNIFHKSSHIGSQHEKILKHIVFFSDVVILFNCFNFQFIDSHSLIFNNSDIFVMFDLMSLHLIFQFLNTHHERFSILRELSNEKSKFYKD